MILSLPGQILRRDRVLATAGLFHLILFALMLAVATFDTRTVSGINPWWKPMKFAVSIAAYLWTLAWFVPYARGPRRRLGIVRWGISAVMVVEMLCIGLQAGRGTTSHFNNATSFDALLWTIMSVGILLNTILDVVFLAMLWVPKTSLPPGYLWGIRLGFLIFLAGGLEGLAMVGRGGHTIGAPDGGPGLPLLNWSTRAGDLRVAHLLGLHALQLVPLAGFGLTRAFRMRPSWQQVAGVAVVAAMYAVLTVWLFRLAWLGQPLVEL